jgi:hypothetical protein
MSNIGFVISDQQPGELWRRKMTAVVLRFSDEPTVTVPAELARLAGLEEGDVEIMLGDLSLTVVPASAASAYAARWVGIAARLREEARQFEIPITDPRDDTYWEIVNPLLEDAGRMLDSE